MFALLSQRLYTLLQFTRMALVFTAISNAWASMLLQAHGTQTRIQPWYAVAMTGVSIGLYSFGMALNDLIDRRRDKQMAPGRPIPSGRMSVRAGHVVCFLLALFAVLCGMWIYALRPDQSVSLLLVLWTILLIIFYDFAGKYLVGLGLLTLGLIRFFNAAIAAPSLAIPWQAILLLVHVTILSTVCYYLEGKRPALTRRHIFFVAFGLVAIVGTLIWLLVDHRRDMGSWLTMLWVTPGLLWPWTAVLLFALVAIITRWLVPDPRRAGRSIMLYGLLWLIVYDAAFVQCYIGWRYSLMIFALLPVAFIAVQFMRAWARLLDLATRPEYQRAR